VHVLIYFTIVQPQPLCTSQRGGYEKFYSFFNFIIWGLISLFTMLTFSLLAIRNARQQRRRVINQNNITLRQLIRMMLVQSLILGLSASAASIGTIYIASDGNSTDSIITARKTFITNVLSYIGLVGSCTSFYLFTLSSKLFRRELLRLFCYRRLFQELLPECNRCSK
jgi:hypothetical protein